MRLSIDLTFSVLGDHPNLALKNTVGFSTSNGLRALNASAYWTPTRLPTYRSSAL